LAQEAVSAQPGSIRSTTSTITLADRWDHFLARWAVDRSGHRVEPGLYSLGSPTADSPVFVTANYTLSFDALRSALAGTDGYILVLDTKGINVWCAAGKGSFGTDELVHRIMEEKRAEGTTLLTIVHHRETPLRILKKTVDVGPVWATEVIHAQSTDLKFDVVEPGQDLDQRDKINYFVCRLKRAPHPENAENFYEFIRSDSAQEIYERYGFVPHK